jgi:hypothetical protein
MRPSGGALLLAAALGAGLLVTPRLARALAAEEPAGAELAGHWTANRELSDDLRARLNEKIRAGGGPPRAPLGGPGSGARFPRGW